MKYANFDGSRFYDAVFAREHGITPFQALCEGKRLRLKSDVKIGPVKNKGRLQHILKK